MFKKMFVKFVITFVASALSFAAGSYLFAAPSAPYITAIIVLSVMFVCVRLFLLAAHYEADKDSRILSVLMTWGMGAAIYAGLLAETGLNQTAAEIATILVTLGLFSALQAWAQRSTLRWTHLAGVTLLCLLAAMAIPSLGLWRPLAYVLLFLAIAVMQSLTSMFIAVAVALFLLTGLCLLSIMDDPTSPRSYRLARLSIWLSAINFGIFTVAVLAPPVPISSSIWWSLAPLVVGVVLAFFCVSFVESALQFPRTFYEVLLALAVVWLYRWFVKDPVL